jgi:putative aldouronate transport system substrate-binding protein
MEDFMKKILIFMGTVFMAAFILLGCAKENTATETPRLINMITVSTHYNGIPDIELKVNAIIEPLINVRVKYTGFDFGSYYNQLAMMMASQEKMDLVATLPMSGSGHFNTMAAQNQLMDITDLLNEYGQDMVREMNDVLPGMLEGTTVNKRIMGVTGFYNKVLNDYIFMRNDILEKHNIDVSGVKSLDDFEAILEKVRILEPTLAPIAQANADGVVLSMESGVFYDIFSKPKFFDTLGDSGTRLGVVFMDTPDKVVNMYKSEEYYNNLQRIRRWYQSGWVYKDAMISTANAEELARTGKVFSWITASEIGAEIAKTAGTGYPIKAIKMTSGPITTSSLRKFAWIIPSFSKEGISTVKFLNLMYTRADISNLLALGIEGRDYEIKPDGTAGYPAGINASNVAYHGVDFLAGNQFITRVWEGNDPNLRELAKRENQEAVKSPILGFAFDPTPIQNEISAITNIIAQYRPSLESGATDPVVELPKFLKALDDAGAEKVILEMQKQLDAWKQTK